MFRLLCLGTSLAAHAGVVALVALPRTDPEPRQGIKGADVFEVTTVDLAALTPPPPPKSPPRTPPVLPPAPKTLAARKPAPAPPPETPPEPAAAAPSEQPAPAARQKGLSDESQARVAAWQRSVVLTISAAKTYPATARKARHEGEVIVSFTINRSGAVLSQHVLTSSGHAELDDAALTVLQTLGRLPPPPAHVAGETIKLAVPFKYSMAD